MTPKPLLDLLVDQHRPMPLAERCRPKTLSEIVGQGHILGDASQQPSGAPLSPIRQLIESRSLMSLMLWGPPGVGKTTLARLIADYTEAQFVQLSAVSSGVAELRQVVQQAEALLASTGQPTMLFIDEIHRYSKTQQDALLPYVERGTVYLIGATTENPSFQVVPALLSRMLLVRLNYLEPEEIQRLIQRGLDQLALEGITVLFADGVMDFLVHYANGDGRSALQLLDVAVQGTPFTGEVEGQKRLTLEQLELLAQQNRLNYDRQGDEHYDHASAFQKSLRGSDADAAIYWLAKMIAAGEDPRFIARRLVVTASEDVGNAAPYALTMALSAAEAAERLGWPEARIPLAQATIYVAHAKKSNQAIVAIDRALADIQRHGKSYPVPPHLKDSHYKDAKTKYGHGVGYVYSHAHPEVAQSFLPDPLVGTRYVEPLSSPQS